MPARLFLLLLALLAAGPAAAATLCDFAYNAELRDALVRPALAALAVAKGRGSDFTAGTISTSRVFGQPGARMAL